MRLTEIGDMAQKFGYTEFISYHYRVIGRDLNYGLRPLRNDSDVMDMVKWVHVSRKIEVYLEHIPDDQLLELEKFNPFYHASVVIEEIGSDTSNVEGEGEVEVEVERNVEWGGLGRKKQNDERVEVPHIDCLELDVTFDDLKSINGSSDEEAESNRVRYLEFNPNTDMADPQFKVGMVFGNAKIFKVAVKEHGIKIGKATKIVYNRQVNFTWLSKKYLETLKSNPSILVQSFKQIVQKDHKVGISRSQVYRTKRKAQELIEGSLMEQYAKLWDYCEEIKRTNPGTTIIVKEDDEESQNGEHEIDEAKPRFQRIFVCFGGCKQGFLAGYKPFIGVDACHLKGPYKG
ncbi:uncharacterized protein LOC114322469 [Camellia sinensis]|uniref:uncharacterized protein LOC114322469 n=1 Tax=Camellia sinensis TaxID=4442 RepID=UPI001035D6AB|nr:uncharacterized protein LOC114322469 [Camellia sinensis]